MNAINAIPLSEWWPARQLQRKPLRRVFVCGRQSHPPLYSHVVNFPRLELPLAGCYENTIETDSGTRTVRLRPGEAIFAAPNCWNLPVWRPGLQLMSLLFGSKQIGASIVTIRSPQGPQLDAEKFSVPRPLSGPALPVIESMVALQAAGGPPEIFADLARALLYCVHELFAQAAALPEGGRLPGTLESICVFLQNHYQYDVTRDSVAEQFGITPNHLSRLFQTHGHMTFSNYLTHVRVDRAKHLLRNYNLKLDEVAARCGYHDASYFCHVFKRLVKMTPAGYRARSRAT